MLNKNSVEYRQAALSLNYEIEVIYRRNIEFFKKEDPSLYKLFNKYKPKKLRLQLSEEGYLNLFNIDTGQAVYKQDPIEYARLQVDHYLSTRPAFALNLTLADNGRDGYPYTKCLSELDREYDKIYPGISVKRDGEVPQLFMFGGGLFLQLEFLLNQLDVKNLSIFESNHDSFYASLHLVDWSQIYAYFSREGYSLNFNLIGNDSANLNKLASIYMDKGFHHFPRVEQFFHYTNDDILKLISSFKSNLQIIIGSHGFFEYERIVLAHTLINIDKTKLVARNNLTELGNCSDLPVFIVGNGPSLDQLEETIFENQSNAIIVSCGSALSALIKKGIKPDLHIEQERMFVVPKWIRESTTAEEREGISLIALNPCHPDTFDMFEKSYVALKPADLGCDLFEKLDDGRSAYSNHCLPLVGNLAVSSIINLGFKNIYLAGLDCGMLSKENHHSKDSNYFAKNTSYDKETIKTYQDFGVYEVKGNFRDKVYTTSLYNYSRIEIEALLAKYSVNCMNLSDGAYIEGAKPVKTLIKLPSIKSKAGILEGQLSQAFNKVVLNENKVNSLVAEIQHTFIENMLHVRKLFNIKGLSQEQIIKNFDTLELILKAMHLSNDAVFRLLHGSLRGLAYKLSVAKANLNDENFNNYLKVAEPLLDRFFDEINESVTNGFFDYDKDY